MSATILLLIIIIIIVDKRNYLQENGSERRSLSNPWYHIEFEKWYELQKNETSYIENVYMHTQHIHFTLCSATEK